VIFVTIFLIALGIPLLQIIISMNWNQYLQYTEEILNGEHHQEPYNDPHFLEYTKLNHSRMNRWLKHGTLNEELVSKIKNISTPQIWILITEPWCGDAAHNVPFIAMLSELNPLILLDIQLRDSDSEIDQYLTNGGKAIPKLIVRDELGNDIFVWGPRPKIAQELFLQLKEKGLELEQQKIELQQWYNHDKGQSLQLELLAL
jgi:hypothetical protein